jgi:hypothetical protein
MIRKKSSEQQRSCSGSAVHRTRQQQQQHRKQQGTQLVWHAASCAVAFVGANRAGYQLQRQQQEHCG